MEKREPITDPRLIPANGATISLIRSGFGRYIIYNRRPVVGELFYVLKIGDGKVRTVKEVSAFAITDTDGIPFNPYSCLFVEEILEFEDSREVDKDDLD